LTSFVVGVVHHSAAMTELPEHVARNRGYWDKWAREYVDPGRKNWESAEPSWGIWKVRKAG
jgi:hypothetical protein